MFGVFENDKPASREGYPHLNGDEWKTHKFATKKEALEYAHIWMGDWAACLPKGWCGEKVEIAYTDFEIRKLKE